MQNNFFSDKPAQVGRNIFIFSGNWINLYPLQHYRDEKQMENNEQKAPFSPILIMEFISIISETTQFPLNVITSLFGIPVILMMMLKNNK